MNLSADQNSIESPTRFTKLSVWQVGLLLLAVSGTYFSVRVAIIGMPPFTDGGAYSCFAYFAAAVEQSFPAAPINFYPGCLSIFGFDADAPLLRIRLADAAICSLAVGLASILVYRISNVWIGLMLGLLFAVTWLHPDFTNGGLKNSILPAFGCVAAALLLFSYPNAKAQLAGGMLVPLIVFLREPLAIAAIVVLASSFILHGRRCFLLAVGGCLIGSVALLAWLWAFRGPPWEVLANYADLQAMFEKLKSEYYSPWLAFTSSLYPMLALWIGAASGLIIVCLRRDSSQRPILLVAALLFAAPMLEILLKVSFSYHWMQLSLAMILVAGVGLASLDRLFVSRRGLVSAGVSFLLLALLTGHTILNWDLYKLSFRESKRFAPVMVYGDWDHPCVEHCFYLSLAKHIRVNTREDEPIVVSGFYYVLYPLSQRMPADARTFDASFATYADFDTRRTDWLEATKAAASPALVVETFRLDVSPMLREMVADYPNKYAVTYEIPVDTPIRYAGFGARVWAKHDQGVPNTAKVESATEPENR